MSLQPTFQRYRPGAHESGVIAFALEDDAIHVQFQSGDVYVYSAASTGVDHLDRLKQLALAGAGLNTYISQQIHSHYARKYRP